MFLRIKISNKNYPKIIYNSIIDKDNNIIIFLIIINSIINYYDLILAFFNHIMINYENNEMKWTIE